MNGCQSSVEFIISSWSEQNMEAIRIFPNPTSTELYIDLTRSSSPIETLQLVSTNGQLIRRYPGANPVIDIARLSEGLYILQIVLADGLRINKRVLVLRSE